MADRGCGVPGRSEVGIARTGPQPHHPREARQDSEAARQPQPTLWRRVSARVQPVRAGPVLTPGGGGVAGPDGGARLAPAGISQRPQRRRPCCLGAHLTVASDRPKRRGSRPQPL